MKPKQVCLKKNSITINEYFVKIRSISCSKKDNEEELY